MEHGSRKATIAAFSANLAIAVAKFVGFLITGAASMLAEAVHSVADTTNQGLLLLGGARSRRDPNPQHPFGYGRERYFWAFVVSLLLFTLGSLFALFEGEEKLRNPHELESVGWAVGILVIAFVAEGLSLRTAVGESAKLKAGSSWWAFIRRSKSPELPVVLLEDSGALLGLAFALIGVVLAKVTGNPRFDALGSIAIGLLLGFIAITLSIEMKSLLIGESASPQQRDAIRGALLSDPRVRRVSELRTEHFGPDELLVGATVDLDGDLDLAEVTRVMATLEGLVREAVPQSCFIYLEPEGA
ncbi:MAG: cation diffusion facilitator family transporter [Acidimicrobiales bacterium]